MRWILPVAFAVLLVLDSGFCLADDGIICTPPRKGQASNCGQASESGKAVPSVVKGQQGKSFLKKKSIKKGGARKKKAGRSAALNSSIIDWIDIPAGTFKMGSRFGDRNETPVHEVTLSAFRIAKTEVTVAQYRKCAAAGKCRLPDVDPDCNHGVEGRDDYPMNCLSREMAADFARFVGGRLPTEAEWEYAAGLGQGSVKGRKYVLSVEDYSGETDDGKKLYTEIMDYAWFRSNSGGKCHPVATRKPNAVGLFDMLGNIMEWVSDWMSDYPSESVTNPTGPTEGAMALVRGGGWQSHGFETRVHDRQYTSPDTQGIYLGVRPVMDLQTSP